MRTKTTRIIVVTMLAVVALSGNAIATTTNRVYSTNQTVGGEG